MRLADLWTGQLTWRRLAVLVAHLPRESATVRAQHGEVVEWGATEHLLAHVVDLLAASNWQRAQQRSKTRITRPKPLPRPGDKRGAKIGRTTKPAGEVKAWLASMSAEGAPA